MSNLVMIGALLILACTAMVAAHIAHGGGRDGNCPHCGRRLVCPRHARNKPCGPTWDDNPNLDEEDE